MEMLKFILALILIALVWVNRFEIESAYLGFRIGLVRKEYKSLTEPIAQITNLVEEMTMLVELNKASVEIWRKTFQERPRTALAAAIEERNHRILECKALVNSLSDQM